IAIFHKNTGQLAVQIRDFNDVVIVNVDLGLWSPVSGQEYEIEFNYDVTTGEHRLFVNGTQFGATQTGTGVRDTNINLYRVGSSYTAAASSNFKVKEITTYSTVQHTADYTTGEVVPETIYSISNSKVVMNTTVRGDSLLTFSEVSTKAGLDEIKYNILQNSQPLWYDGLS
ncbi:MAG: hypothetical protein GY782_04365, partial [Gammaproteobacteria bacterium]|nr:hypothetical protein [Gammaproteobacteria bacterium]